MYCSRKSFAPVEAAVYWAGVELELCEAFGTPPPRQTAPMSTSCMPCRSSLAEVKNELHAIRHSVADLVGKEERPLSGSKGPPVVLFPSLAGSVLECEESPVEGFDSGTRIWMGLSTLLGASLTLYLEHCVHMQCVPRAAQLSASWVS